MILDGGWLTGARVDRLPAVLRRVRAEAPPGIPVGRAAKIAWEKCGGPLDDVEGLISVLVATGLLSTSAGFCQVTKLGREIATQDHHTGGRRLAQTLLRTGLFAEQVRLLSESSRPQADGTWLCPRQRAVEVAPQLVGLIRRFEGVVLTDELVVPAQVVVDLAGLWALEPLARPDRDDLKKSVGSRAELYSYQFERLRSADSSKVRWVARDDETLGYDVEDLNPVVARRIEVKGSGAEDVRFYLTSHEMKVMQDDTHPYELQFWGGIELHRAADTEFEMLRDRGFPIVWKDARSAFAAGELVALPHVYIVTAGVRADLA